jgi:hypothetical protein
MKRSNTRNPSNHLRPGEHPRDNSSVVARIVRRDQEIQASNGVVDGTRVRCDRHFYYVTNRPAGLPDLKIPVFKPLERPEPEEPEIPDHDERQWRTRAGRGSSGAPPPVGDEHLDEGGAR